RQQPLEPLVPLRRHNTEFGHMRPQGIDHLSPLPDQQIARAMLHQLTLLLGRFDPDKTHGGAANRLADRPDVGRVILVALNISLHILRRHHHINRELAHCSTRDGYSITSSVRASSVGGTSRPTASNTPCGENTPPADERSRSGSEWTRVTGPALVARTVLIAGSRSASNAPQPA